MQLIQQGGFLAVLVAVLYFYRRDYLKLLGEKEQTIASLTNLIEKSTESMTRNYELGERLTRAIEGMNSRRRLADT